MPCEMFLDILILRREAVSISPNPPPPHVAGRPPLVGCPRLLTQHIYSYPPQRRPLLHPKRQDTPCCCDPDPLTGMQSNLFLWLLVVIWECCRWQSLWPSLWHYGCWWTLASYKSRSFPTENTLWVGPRSHTPVQQPGGPGYPFLSRSSPMSGPAWQTLRIATLRPA